MDALQWFLFFVFVAFGVWVLYKMVQMYDKAKEANDEEAPYKLETPYNVAVPAQPYKYTAPALGNAPKPKRKYTKRKTAAKKKVREHRRKQNRKLK